MIWCQFKVRGTIKFRITHFRLILVSVVPGPSNVEPLGNKCKETSSSFKMEYPNQEDIQTIIEGKICAE